MTEKNDGKEYSIGYRKPPRHAQFKKGQSGNPQGRPKKDPTLADIFTKELRVLVPLVSNGQPRKCSMLKVIVKQILKKAASGDAKAAALVIKLLQQLQFNRGNNIDDLVQEFRAINARHAAVDRNEEHPRDGGPQSS